MTSTDVGDKQGNRGRWGWVLSCELAGSILIGIAYYTEARWNWQGVTPSVLVNLGTALLIAGVLFFIERRFIGAVERVTEKAADQAVAGAERRIAEKTDALAARLTDVQDRLEQRLAERASGEDAATRGLFENVSFESTVDALNAAINLNSICDESLTVPANRDRLPRFVIRFRWASGGQGINKRPGEVSENVETNGSPHLDIEAHHATKNMGMIFFVADVVWDNSKSAIDVGEDLTVALQRSGQWQGGADLDWPFCLESLQRGLDIAIRSRRRDANAWHLTGRLRELVGMDWAITETAIEAPGHGYVLQLGYFKNDIDEHFEEAMRGRLPHREKPDWADKEEWEYILQKVGDYFLRQNVLLWHNTQFTEKKPDA
jgi:hypothetical protein